MATPVASFAAAAVGAPVTPSRHPSTIAIEDDTRSGGTATIAPETMDERHRARVEHLCSFEDRRAGTDAERRAANDLAATLRADGAAAAVEPTYVHPHWPGVAFVHCLIAIVGSLLAGVSALAGFVVVLFAAVSLFGDLSGRWYLVRSVFFFRRASQNVVSPPLPPALVTDEGGDEIEQPARIIVSAHVDSPLTGAAYNDWALRAWTGFARIWPARTSPQSVIFWAIALLLPPLGARMAGVDAQWISALQLPQTFILLIAAFFLAEIALSPASPGGNDDAAGVAAALAVAERLREERPQSLEVVLLLAGAGETTRQGARAFIRAHRRQLPKDRTWFIDIDSPGRGDARFVAVEIPVVAQPVNRELGELCAALCDGEADRGELALGPATSASLAGAYGYPSIALTARETNGFVPRDHHTPDDTAERIEPEAIERVAALTVDLIRLLDREVGRREKT